MKTSTTIKAAAIAAAILPAVAAHAQPTTVTGTVVGVFSGKQCYHVVVMKPDTTLFSGAIPTSAETEQQAAQQANDASLASGAYGQQVTFSTTFSVSPCVNTSLPVIFNLQRGVSP